MRIWTEEARAAQSALMKRLKPWTKSTGPRTLEGKAKAAKNSYKTGLHCKTMKKVRKYFRDCREFIKFLKTEYYKSPAYHARKDGNPAFGKTDYYAAPEIT